MSTYLAIFVIYIEHYSHEKNIFLHIIMLLAEFIWPKGQ